MRKCWPLPLMRDNAERARNKFVEIQTLIDALDRAIRREKPVRQELGEGRDGDISAQHAWHADGRHRSLYCCLAHSTIAAASAPACVSQVAIASVAAFRSAATRDAGAGSAIWTPLSRMRA